MHRQPADEFRKTALFRKTPSRLLLASTACRRTKSMFCRFDARNHPRRLVSSTGTSISFPSSSAAATIQSAPETLLRSRAS
jgi:hypothetical protein